jgi:glycosyltransferase involved in cell wall biosynthesis
VLFVTSNSFLRSTTSSLNAIIRRLQPQGLEPVMLFREHGPWVEELEKDGIPCHFAKLRHVDRRRPVRSLIDTWQLVRLIQRHQIDLVHCNEHENYPAIRVAARWTGRPTVVTFHFKVEQSLCQWLFRKPFQPAGLQFISRAQLDYCRPAVAGTAAEHSIKLLMSGLEVDDFVARGAGEHGLREQWNIASGEVVIGTASALKSHKHLDQFIELIYRLRQRGLPVRGLIAGGGRFADPVYQRTLETQVRRLGLENHLALLGNLDPLTPFLKSLDLFVSTSEWETFGMSICEAQACGVPTLTYAVGGNPEALPDAWCTAPFGDLDALEAKVAKLVTDAAFRRELGQRAERFVREHFDAPVLAARQLAIYEEILGRPLSQERDQQSRARQSA